ncbi:DUF6585 family protein [Actinomadura macrotermitis]|uniref:Uncharacterized protein n=1 Tax=Actinomadura macrotermitis TaxID=2585200 RepID=A0A7K0BYE2_9ACTN|nr:DUF6585 family protein [Actinomadura macrotermitis]MQY06207.1 hypothetical protein [Actinomadura macrotermitis]
MSEQSTRVHDDGQSARRAADAAAREGLGLHRAAYPAKQAPPLNPSARIIGAVVLALGAVGVLALFLSGQSVPAVMLAVPVGVATFVYVMSWPRPTGYEGARLDLFEHGLTCAMRGELHVVRYDRTSVLQDIVRHTQSGITSYTYTLTDTGGRRFHLTGMFTAPDEWGPAIQQGVTTAQLPRAVAALRAGERLTFGDIWLTAREVGSGQKGVPWAQVQDVKIHDGVVRIKVAGRWRALTTALVRWTPNFFVFLTLAQRLRETEER